MFCNCRAIVLNTVNQENLAAVYLRISQISVISRILIWRIVVSQTTISTLCIGNEYILRI